MRPKPVDPIASRAAYWPFQDPPLEVEYRVVDERDRHWRAKSAIALLAIFGVFGALALGMGLVLGALGLAIGEPWASILFWSLAIAAVIWTVKNPDY